MAFSPDGRTLASSEWQPPDLIHGSTQEGGATTVRLWDLATGQPATLPSRQRRYAGKALAFHPRGRILACSPGMDGTLQLLDLNTGQATTLAGHALGIETAAISPDGHTLASAGTDHTVRLWDPATGRPTATLFGHTELVTSAAFSTDGHTLATGSRDGTVRLWTPGDPPR